jgi:hypothetical protein
MNLVPNLLLLKKSGSAGNRNGDLRICNQELCLLDRRGGSKYRLSTTSQVTLYE